MHMYSKSEPRAESGPPDRRDRSGAVETLRIIPGGCAPGPVRGGFGRVSIMAGAVLASCAPRGTMPAPSATVPAVSDASGIDSASLSRDLHAFAADSMGGRETG